MKRGGRQWIGGDARPGTMVTGNGRTIASLGRIPPRVSVGCGAANIFNFRFLKSRTVRK